MSSVKTANRIIKCPLCKGEGKILRSKIKLTAKQLHFVKKYMNEKKPASEIVQEVYQPRSKDVATTMAKQLMENPKIQNELRTELEALYPGSRQNRFRALHRIIDDETDKYSPKDVIAAVKALNEMVGDIAPTKHFRAEAKVIVPQLPGSKNE